MSPTVTRYVYAIDFWAGVWHQGKGAQQFWVLPTNEFNEKDDQLLKEGYHLTDFEKYWEGPFD